MLNTFPYGGVFLRTPCGLFFIHVRQWRLTKLGGWGLGFAPTQYFEVFLPPTAEPLRPLGPHADVA